MKKPFQIFSFALSIKLSILELKLVSEKFCFPFWCSSWVSSFRNGNTHYHGICVLKYGEYGNNSLFHQKIKILKSDLQSGFNSHVKEIALTTGHYTGGHDWLTDFYFLCEVKHLDSECFLCFCMLLQVGAIRNRSNCFVRWDIIWFGFFQAKIFAVWPISLYLLILNMQV